MEDEKAASVFCTSYFQTVTPKKNFIKTANEYAFLETDCSSFRKDFRDS